MFWLNEIKYFISHGVYHLNVITEKKKKCLIKVLLRGKNYLKDLGKLDRCQTSQTVERMNFFNKTKAIQMIQN